MPIFASNTSRLPLSLAATACLVLMAAQPANAQEAATTFFVTSVGIGNGANLGGVAGADNHCQELAQAAGANASGVKTRCVVERPSVGSPNCCTKPAFGLA